MGSLWSLPVVPLLIALNAFFVAAEYAVVAAREAHIQRLRDSGRKRASAALARLKAEPADAIGAIQVCITLTNLMLGYFGEPAMTALLINFVGPLANVVPDAVFRGGSLVLSFLVVTHLTVVFSELLPKALTLRYVETVARFTAAPVVGILTIARPLVWLMNATANLVTRPLGLGRVQDADENAGPSIDEIRLLTSQAAAAGELSPRERSLILNGLALGRRSAREIMVPRMRVAFLDLKKSMDDNRRVMNEYLYSRLPLCDGGFDKVIGLVPTKEFLSAFHAEGDSSVLQLIARPAVFAPETATLDKLLVMFDEHRTQQIFIVDEHGGVEGIVTLRDVLDELVGQPLARPEGERIVVPGETPIHDLAEMLGRPGWASGEAVVTVGGLVSARLGRIPRSGEELLVDGVNLKVVESDGRAARRIAVVPVEPGSGSDGGGNRIEPPTKAKPMGGAVDGAPALV